jgi:hypothetical protein
MGDYVIRALNKTFFRMNTGIGPCFGGTLSSAFGFATQADAQREMLRWPMVAEVGCEVVKRKQEPKRKKVAR